MFENPSFSNIYLKTKEIIFAFRDYQVFLWWHLFSVCNYKCGHWRKAFSYNCNAYANLPFVRFDKKSVCEGLGILISSVGEIGRWCDTRLLFSNLTLQAAVVTVC